MLLIDERCEINKDIRNQREKEKQKIQNIKSDYKPKKLHTNGGLTGRS